MNTTPSNLYSTRQLNGLRKLGDVMMPGNGAFPSFSDSGCIAAIDTAMGSAHPADIRDFGLLLWLCHLAPTFVIRGLVHTADRADRFPPLMAAQLRKANIGLKGVVVSLYYSGQQGLRQNPTPLDVIDYHLTCDTSDLRS